MTNTILRVENLGISFDNWSKALKDISYCVNKGEILGVVGESGSGKSIMGKAIMGLLDRNASVTGNAFMGEYDLLSLSEKQLCKVRGKEISMVFQDPVSALSPVDKVGKQVEEIYRIHHLDTANMESEVNQIFKDMGVDNPKELLAKYPFQLSGGLAQRVMIAMALLCKPKLIIADEPTTALDVTTGKEVLKIFKKIKDTMGTSILLITHDMGVIAEVADRVMVMYHGEIVEISDVFSFFDKAQSPYAIDLQKAMPVGFEKRFMAIKGEPPNIFDSIVGCAYESRCNLSIPICKEIKPELKQLCPNHFVRCHLRECGDANE